MTTYRYDPDTGKVLPSHLVAQKRRKSNKRSTAVPSPYFMSDIKPFVSPVGNDPEVISSRPQLKEHEKKHNCHQVGNDFPVGSISAKNEAKKSALQKKASGLETGWVEFGN